MSLLSLPGKKLSWHVTDVTQSDPRYPRLRQHKPLMIGQILQHGSAPIGLYHDVWIALSRTRLEPETAVMCVYFQRRRVRHNADYTA